MKKGKIIILIIFITVVVGIILYFYYFYEKPIKKEAESNYVNVNFLSFDEFKRPLTTNYRIYINNILYKEGETILGGAILEKVPINSTFKIEGIKEDYYTYLTNNTLAENGTNYRVEMNMVEIGDLKVNISDELLKDEFTNFTLYSEGVVKDLLTCIKWSFNFLNVNILNHEIIENPKLYNSYDRCYDLKKTIDKDSFKLSLNYTIFSNLKEDDYINITFIDRDTTIEGKISEKDDKDIGMLDKTLNLKF